MQKRKRRFGDRYDGYRLRKIDPLFVLIPHIMRSRLDSQVLFEEELEITKLEKFIRQKRKSDIPNLAMVHVVIAAAVRMLALQPALNRFVCGKHTYARNHIRLSMAIKRSMTIEGEETTIMPEFDPYDTLKDVVEKFNKEIIDNKPDETTSQNGTDKISRILSFCPAFFLTFFVTIMRSLDKIGFMPKLINKVSPFHSSLFITDVGSLGISSIYHHLYEFGTCSIFIAMGKKETKLALDDDGNIVKRKVLSIKFVLDERICDGFYYASSIKDFKRFLNNPERLEVPPKEIFEDPQI